MSAAISPSTGRSYGLSRVCRLWRVPRSSFYAARSACPPVAVRATTSGTEAPASPTHEDVSLAPSAPRSLGGVVLGAPSGESPLGEVAPAPAVASVASVALGEVSALGGIASVVPGGLVALGEVSALGEVASVAPGARPVEGVVPVPRRGISRSALVAASPRRRGPRPALEDEAVLTLVRTDLAASPFVGEGHRKVAARLRRAGHRVHRRQVLRVMREAKLLSPHRARQGTERAHDGTIVTDTPNELWGTDGVRVATVDEGWVWIFLAVEHWNGECVGWHAAKIGDRYAALQPIAQGLTKYFGGVQQGAARGLSLRLDHGTQYTSEHFVREARYWDLTLSYGYVAEPETNGVAERFNRTLKEQVIHGCVYRNLAELRAAVGAFVAKYNAEWLLEKNGYRSPLELREAVALKKVA